MNIHSFVLSIIARFLVADSNEGVLNQLVVSRLPIASPGDAFKAFSEQVGEVRVEVKGLPVIFARSPFSDSGDMSVLSKGAYPGCVDAAEKRAEREILSTLSMVPSLSLRSLRINVFLYDDHKHRSVAIGTVVRWVAPRLGRRLFTDGLRPTTLDLMDVSDGFLAPSSGRFWVSLGSLWEVNQAVLDIPGFRGGDTRAQLSLLIRPESGEVIFPFFAVADCASVLWVEVSPKIFGVVLPCKTYLRASTKDGLISIIQETPPFWRGGDFIEMREPIERHWPVSVGP